jgi:TonB-linked SusC/RagA family outer membrane protein
MKKLSVLLMVFFATLGSLLAQRTITGKVTDAKGEGIIGANVVAKGTNTGAATDSDGNYRLNVPNGTTTLAVTYVGFNSKEVALGASNVVDVTLEENSNVFTDVVVTALGIKRDKKALGYASTAVSAAELEAKPETDVARAITGRSAGIQISNSSGLAGSGTKINIRGVSTISGDAQPLWIIDGVPVNTSANNKNGDFRDGLVSPTRNLDIDPNNIESMNILRGLSATTLYGSQGRNGVILITTKSGANGKGKMNASLSQSYNVIDAFVPEYQNKFANGFDGDYGEYFSNWGPLFSNNVPVGKHPYYEHRALFPDHPEFADKTGYIPQPQPNNVKNFFQQGSSATTSFNAGVTNGIGSFNVSFSHLDEKGYIKNNNLQRNNISMGGMAKLTDKLDITSNFSFVTTNFRTPPVGAGTGSNSEGGPSVFANLFYTPRNIDLTNWPYENPVTHASVYYRNNNSITNPRWLLDYAKQTSSTNRFFSSSSVNYKLASWLKATYRLGIDTYTDNQEYAINRGAVGFPAEAAVLATGIYRTSALKNTIFDHSIILSSAKSITKDLDYTANVGVNARQDLYKQNGLESTNQVVFGLFEHRNFIDNNDRDFRKNNLNYIENKTLLGAFADVTFGYKSYLYLNLQGRKDWASTHEKAYRSLFYPGFSLSFIPTDAFQINSKALSFLKLRLGYGTSANFATPYNTRPFIELVSGATSDAGGNVNTLSYPSLLANPNLAPELQRELEGGMEARLLNNRVSIDLSLYRRIAEGQIVERPLDPSTGFTKTYINAGTISNKGIELGLGITPIQRGDFSWTVRANFTKNISLVDKLPDGSKEILISGFSDLGSFAIEGQPFGVIKGTAVEKNAKGEYLITSNGDYKKSADTKIIGNPNPDYMLSTFTDIKFKGFTLGGQFDYVHGGQMFSYSAATLVGRGVAKELESFDPGLPVILPGVLEDGTKNNIPMPASQVFYGNTIIGGGPNDRGIFDATRVRLREVYLNYTFPSSLFQNKGVRGATISLVANNVWFRALNMPIYSKVDADRTAFGTGNGQGFDFLGGPSARRMGVNVRLTF